MSPPQIASDSVLDTNGAATAAAAGKSLPTTTSSGSIAMIRRSTASSSTASTASSSKSTATDVDAVRSTSSSTTSSSHDSSSHASICSTDDIVHDDNHVHAQDGTLPPDCDDVGDDEHYYDPFYYLTPNACHHIPKFQYNGKDLSLLYKHVLSPIAEFFVQRCVPTWLAPNTITLIGLCFMISSYSIIWYYIPYLVYPASTSDDNSDDNDERENGAGGYVPNWIFLCNAMCMLLYQTLDNMDGKQARKTGSSSPLGLLFDHGVDALNSVFGSTNWIIAMALDPKQDASLCWVLLFGPYAMFFIGTWEEYYTGQLIMPIINGPSEGLLGGALLSFTSFLYGPQFWQQTPPTLYTDHIVPVLQTVLPNVVQWDTLRNADIMVFVACFGFLQEIISKVWHVSKLYGTRSLQSLLPFVTLATCTFVFTYTTDSIVWVTMPRTCLHLCAFLFVEMTTALMLAHISHEHYQLSSRWILVPLVVFTVLAAATSISSEMLQHFVVTYTSCAGVYLLMKTSIIIHEISTLLQIWCFDITTPRNTTNKRSLHTIQSTRNNHSIQNITVNTTSNIHVKAE